MVLPRPAYRQCTHTHAQTHVGINSAVSPPYLSFAVVVEVYLAISFIMRRFSAISPVFTAFFSARGRQAKVGLASGWLIWGC